MVYKIRVILDAKDDVFRDIEIRGKQTLWNLHLGIKNAFSLQGEELSAFNLLEDDGTIIKSVPLEDMSDEGDGEIMSDVYINEAFSKVGDKAQFQYGFIDLWEFLCELVSIDDAKPSVQYPITVYRFGNVSIKEWEQVVKLRRVTLMLIFILMNWEIWISLMKKIPMMMKKTMDTMSMKTTKIK